MGTLRLWLALSVLVSHCGGVLGGLPFLPGSWAVQIFYMLSGFTMGMVLELKYKGAYKKFIFNRVVRLYPAYLLILLLTGALFVATFYRGLEPVDANRQIQLNWGQLSPGGKLMIVASNLLLEGKELLLFFRLDPSGPFSLKPYLLPTGQVVIQPWDLHLIPQAWTLGLEFFFYLAAPFLIAWRLRSLALLMLASLGIRLLTYAVGLDKGFWQYAFIPSELYFFVCGLLAWKLSLWREHYGPALRWAAMAAAAYLFYALAASGLHEPGHSDLQGVRFALLLIPVVILLDGHLRTNKVDRYLGKLTYPVYISHLFVLWSVRYSFGLKAEQAPALIAGLTLLLAVLIVRFVEEPVERWRAQASARWAWLQ